MRYCLSLILFSSKLSDIFLLRLRNCDQKDKLVVKAGLSHRTEVQTRTWVQQTVIRPTLVWIVYSLHLTRNLPDPDRCQIRSEKQRWSSHAKCVRWRWDFSLKVILRRIQCKNVFNPQQWNKSWIIAGNKQYTWWKCRQQSIECSFRGLSIFPSCIMTFTVGHTTPSSSIKNTLFVATDWCCCFFFSF